MRMQALRRATTAALLLASVLVAGCAATFPAEVYTRGTYPSCRDEYVPNADCYGGPP
jgi:hypothetical protein